MSDLEILQQLRLEVRYLRDRQDILDCIWRYCRGLDRHDVDFLLSAYHADALDEHGLAINALPEFAAWINTLHDNHFHVTLHNITTHNCDLQGDTAHCESYVLFGLSTRDESQVWFGGGRYLDRLERRGGVWKIDHRRTIIEWLFTGDNALFNSPQFKAWRYPAGRSDRSDDSYQRPLRLDPKQTREFDLQGRKAPDL